MNVGTEMFLEVYGKQKLMVQTECHLAIWQSVPEGRGCDRKRATPTVDRRYDGI